MPNDYLQAKTTAELDEKVRRAVVLLSAGEGTKQSQTGSVGGLKWRAALTPSIIMVPPLPLSVST